MVRVIRAIQITSISQLYLFPVKVSPERLENEILTLKYVIKVNA